MNVDAVRKFGVDALRAFAIVVINDLDEEVDRFDLEYVEAPKNLGFEMEFTTLESRLTTIFTSVREKKLPTTLNLNFVPPNAYSKAATFKQFIQKHMNDRTVLEYNDTIETKRWEGKVQKFGQEELLDWGGLVCPISFFPATPKYLQRNNTIRISFATTGKNYPYSYPYAYGASLIMNNTIDNAYFDEVPLLVTLYGRLVNPRIGLVEVLADGTEKSYTTVQFNGLTIEEDEHLVIDAIQSKVLLWRGGKYVSAYDYTSKQSDLDIFLYAKGNAVSKLMINLNPAETGYLVASYRQYTL